MDDGSHVFLITDKIRCIQKKIMDQLAADLNSALNDTDLPASSLSNLPTTTSSAISLSKSKRRRKRPVNNDLAQPKTEESGSTTPENTRNRTNAHHKQLIVSDGDDIPMRSKSQSSILAAASGSDSASQTDEIRRHRRPFKKPIIPSTSKTESSIKFVRCSSMKLAHSPSVTTVLSTPLRRRRRNCRSEDSSRMITIDENPSTSTSSSFTLAIGKGNCVGKRKRSRAIVHDDFRLRNNNLQDYDMTSIDDPNLANISSSSSVNLSDSDKDPCLTSNEADDEQSDWPREESSVPRVISWWEDDDDDNDEEGDKSDTDEKMLTTTDGTLQKIVNGALNMMLPTSKNNIQTRIKTFVHREMLTGNRRNLETKNTYAHPHPKRHVRLFKDARRSHHNSYGHKRVKSDHYSPKTNDIVAPINPSHLNAPFFDKITWSTTNQPNSNPTSEGIHTRPSPTYENTPMDTSEQSSSLTHSRSHQ